MVNPNKVKGTAFESSLRDYAHKLRLKAFRPAQAGKGDLGDVHIEGIVTVQAKDHATARYNEWLEDVEQQRKNSGLLFGVVVHKKRRAPVGDARVVMTYDTLLSMIDRLGKAERMVNTNPATAYAFAQLLVDKE